MGTSLPVRFNSVPNDSRLRARKLLIGTRTRIWVSAPFSDRAGSALKEEGAARFGDSLAKSAAVNLR
jgi:hypothetical protein